MENDVIITVIIGFIIGVAVTFFFKSKSKNPMEVSTNKVNTSKDETLQANIESLKKEKASLQEKLSDIETLEKEKNKLQKKLADSEKLLKNIQESGGASSDSINLLKEIKRLKDEIDDLEDDLESQEKNNKRLRSEKTEIEESLNVIETEKRDLTVEKEKLSEELKAKIKESEESSKSLTFINDILNASNAIDKNVTEIDNKTWEIYSFISNSVYNCFENYTNDTEDLEDKAWEWRNTELKTWIKNKKVVAIVGEFSAGKTSIVNRILSQDDPNALLLPVSSKETTAVPTYISNSKDFNCQFYSPEGDLRNIKKETFEMVTKSVLDQVNVSHLIKYFVLSYNNTFLNNISILDTPGFGSNSDEIIKKTTNVVKEAHALFWVIDANTGDINQTSIDVMKKDLNEVPLYFIINKSDTKSDGDLQLLEKKIQTTAQNNNIQYQAIIRFSQKENVEVLMKYINEIQIEKQPPLMSHIFHGLNYWIREKEEKKKELNENKKINTENLNIIENNFKVIQDNIVHSVKNIKSLVRKKDNFFTGTKYQIDKLYYNDFLESSAVIENSSTNINNEVKVYFENIKHKIEIDNKIGTNKHELEELNNVKKEFTKLIKDYNPNLLN